MVLYFITGTSTGLGNAIARAALEDGQSVVGIGRRHTIDHERYVPVKVDLSNTDETNQVNFQLNISDKNITKVVLINNAGVIQPVKHLGHTEKEAITKHYNVNLISPVILINNFLKAMSNEDIEQVVINVSSGAAERPMDGWACYCSGKAGLDMVSRVAEVEKKQDNRKLRVYSLAPGIVDTPMQDTIREANESEFSRLEDFKRFKKAGLLVAPGEVAQKFIRIVNNPDLKLNVVDRLN